VEWNDDGDLHAVRGRRPGRDKVLCHNLARKDTEMTTDTPEQHARLRASAAARDRFAWTIAGLVVLLHVVVAWLGRAPGIYADQAVYVALARSLRGFEYREIFYVGAPAHRMYPPGYPLLLAGWSAIGGEGLDWLVVVSLTASAAALLIFFSIVRRHWGSTAAVASLAAIAFNESLLSNAGWILSEAVFTLCSVAALWAASRDRDTRSHAAFAGAAAIAAALTRSAGVTVIAALALYWLWRGRYRRVAVFTVVSGIAVGGWLLFSALAGPQVPGSSYVADAVHRPGDTSMGAALLARTWRNLRYAADFYVATAPIFPGTRIDEAIGLPLAGAAIVAGLIAFWRKWPLSIVYLGAYGTLLLVWPWTQARFLTPLFPWLVAALVIGSGQIAAAVRSGLRAPVVAIVGIVLAVTGFAGATEWIRERQRCGRSETLPLTSCLSSRHDAWASLFSIVGRVRTGVPPDAVFVSPAPATLFLLTERRAAPLTDALGRSSSEFLPFLAAHGARYVILSNVVRFTEGKPRIGGTPLAVMVRDNCDALRLEAEADGSAYLFRLATPGEAPAKTACQAANEFIARFGTEWK
jgi:hypothetical protein